MDQSITNFESKTSYILNQKYLIENESCFEHIVNKLFSKNNAF